MNRWIGLDPSLAAFGWAVFSATPATSYAGPGAEVLEVGVWRTSKAKALERRGRKTQKPGVMADTAARVRQLGEQLDDLVLRVSPVALFTEGLAFPPGRIKWSVISALGQVRGLITGISIARALPLHEFGTQQVKRAFTGRPGGEDGDKDAVAKRVLRIYPRARELLQPFGRLADNAADAMAVGHMGFMMLGQQQLGEDLDAPLTPSAGNDPVDEPVDALADYGPPDTEDLCDWVGA